MAIGISLRMLMVAGADSGTPAPSANYITDSDSDRLLDANADNIIEGGESFAPAVVGVSTTTITSGTINGRDWHGRASLQELSNGNWVLVYTSGAAHADNGDQVLMIRFSDDKGATWTAENTKLGGGAVTGFPMTPPGGGTGDNHGPGEPWLILADDGTLLLHMWLVDVGVSMLGTYQSTSSDGGETWSAASQIDFTGAGAPNDDRVMMTDDHFIVSGVIYAAAREFDDATGTNRKNIFVKSEDNGTSWEYVSDISSFSDRTPEVGIEYLGDSNIIAILRDQDQTVTYKTTSDDMGATWSALSDFTSAVGASGRQRIYTLAHLKGESDWWDDDTLVMVGFEIVEPGNSQPRHNSIWISEDAGVNWTRFHLGEGDEDGGYGDILYDSGNDEYVFVTYLGTSDAASIIQHRLELQGVS